MPERRGYSSSRPPARWVWERFLGKPPARAAFSVRRHRLPPHFPWPWPPPPSPPPKGAPPSPDAAAPAPALFHAAMPRPWSARSFGDCRTNNTAALLHHLGAANSDKAKPLKLYRPEQTRPRY